MVKKNLLGIGISPGNYSEFIQNISQLVRRHKGGYVCVANVHMLIEAYDDPGFSDIVNGGAIVTPDGKPLALMMSWLYGKKQPRVAGMDLLPDLLTESGKKGYDVFFYGGRSDLLEKTLEKIVGEFQDVQVSGTLSPSFGDIDDDVINTHLSRIKAKDPDLIFMALGCPKQERMMARMSKELNGVMIGIGGALPVFAGEFNRAPAWMQKCSLEWFYRLIQEPARLWRRYLYTNTKFILLAVRELFRKKILKKKGLIH